MPAETLASRLADAAQGGGRIVFVDAREREVAISHAELFARAQRAAGGIAARGIEPGERVAIVAATSPAFFDGFFGAILAGAVPVPLYPPVRLGRMQEYHERTAAMLRGARARIVLADSRTRRVLGRSVDLARPELGCVALEEIQDAPLALRELDPGAIAFLQFSSGTTQAPKPVALTHRQILANADAIATAIRAAHPETNGFVHVAASWLPLYHDMGLVGGVFTSLFHGRDLVLIPPELFVVRPALWLRAIARHRATISPAPNFAYALCTERVRDEELDGADLSSWRVALNGAEPVTPLALERFVERFARWGLRPEALTPVYGLAEATLAVTFSAVERPFRVRHFDARALAEEGRAVVVGSGQPIVSLGPPLPGFELAIAGDDGRALGAGTVGRVRARGPSIMAGYDGMPEATRAVFVDGWLDTGDVGFLIDGELHLVGRAKDLIIARGRNHSPQDVEHAIDDLPGVRTGCSAAVGAIDEAGSGETLWVFVERARDAAVADDEIVRAVRARVLQRVGLAAERVVVLAAGTLPRTSSGKIRRSETLRLHQAGRLEAPQRVNLPRLALEMLRSQRAFRRARARR
jgi:acyl-CoA synthetase (AMP-forming)/AMP-acid ligase II